MVVRTAMEHAEAAIREMDEKLDREIAEGIIDREGIAEVRARIQEMESRIVALTKRLNSLSAHDSSTTK